MKKTTKILALSFIAMAFALVGCQMSTETPEQIVARCDQDIDKAKLDNKDLSGEWEWTVSRISKDKDGKVTQSYVVKVTVTLAKGDGTKYKMTQKKGTVESTEYKMYLTEEQKATYSDDYINPVRNPQAKPVERW